MFSSMIMIYGNIDDFPLILLDKIEKFWFNIIIMKQINRKNTNSWWWPEG